jgi:hypothetical protein
VCSRFLSCSIVICRVHVAVPVEHVLSHYCSMSKTIMTIHEGIVVQCVFSGFVCVYLRFLCTAVAPLVVLRWWHRRGGYCFAPFYVLSMFSYCVVLWRLKQLDLRVMLI